MFYTCPNIPTLVHSVTTTQRITTDSERTQFTNQHITEELRETEYVPQLWNWENHS